jgi:hypothetical protein
VGDLLEGGFDVGGGGCAGGVGVAGIGAGNVVAGWRSTQGRVVWRSQWVEMPWAATQGEVVAEVVHRWVVTAGRSARNDLDRRDTPGDADPHYRDVGKGITPMTVSFLLTPEQEQLKAAARGFAQDQLRDLAAVTRAEPDPKTRALLLRPAFEDAVAAGFLKGLIPVPFGGAASSGVDAAIFIEEWAAQSPDFVISLAGPLIALAPVYQVGTPEQVERFVRPFLADSGAPLAAMAFSEPEGSANFDAEGPGQGIRTTAVPDGEEWVINGRKAWASHLCGWDGDGPDIMTIVCRTPSGISLIVAEREHLAGNIEVGPRCRRSLGRLDYRAVDRSRGSEPDERSEIIQPYAHCNPLVYLRRNTVPGGEGSALARANGGTADSGGETDHEESA